MNPITKDRNRTKTSKLFCAPDADVSFLSSDNVLFKLHSMHFRTNSEIFLAPEDAFVVTEAAQLSERAEILELLFQFVEPPPESRNYRYPSVMTLKVEIFFALAEAAEKYIVYGAMSTCITQMPNMIFFNSFKVLNHTVKHGYWEIAENAARRCLEVESPLEEATSTLTSPGVLQKWVVYYNAWRDAGKKASVIFAKNMNGACHIWAHGYTKYLRRIDKMPSLFTLICLPDAEFETLNPCKIRNCTCGALGRNPQFLPWLTEIYALPAIVPKLIDIVI
ncbi:hypothetical protein BDN70DRAFT_321165 [Pholiota conissans]|uniref:BTB domain-containing protein n=1 Tax=Pholiota conissans TaxID=109636 RepID=A0A9P5YTK6_9AGAR|nr:hypothetical protein BDN70DRAFT_321165 [Pholiota conissans]